MESLGLHPVFSSTAAALLLWTAAAAVFFFLIRKDNPFPPGRRRILLFLRSFLLLIFALLLLRPSLQSEGKLQLPASAAVLLDTSLSMSIADYNGQARYAAAEEALREGRAGDDALFSFFRFDETAVPLAADEPLPAEPEGKETAIGSAISAVLDQYAGKRLLGILLVSDGAQRAADPIPPQDVALAARTAGVPICTCTVGSENEADLRDVAVLLPAVPARAYLGNEVTVEGLLRASGCRGETVPLTLYAEGAEIARQEIAISSESQVVPFRFTYTSDEPGQKRLTVSAGVMPGEITPSNNAADAYILFLRGNLRVLFLEGTRRFEDKFIRMALDAKQEISVDYVRLPGGERADEDRQYSVIIIGDIDPDDLDDGERKFLEKEITRGAGVIFLAGLGSIAENKISRFPFLASKAPIRLNDTLDRENAEAGFTGYSLRAAPAEGEGAHYLARLSSEGGRSKKIWNELPPLESVLDLESLSEKTANDRKPKKDAEVILTAADPDGKTFPLLLVGSTGAGRSALLLSDATWRWAMSGMRGAFETFWRQLILWTAGRDVPAPGELDIEQERSVLAPNETVRARVLYMPHNPLAADQAAVSASVITPGGERRPFPLDRERLGTFTETGAPGEYVLQIEVNENGTKTEAVRRFLVRDYCRELESPAADTALARSLAEITRGEVIPPGGTDGFFRSMREKKESAAEPVRHTRYLCDNWLVFALGVALLSVEWLLRKVWGRA